MTATDVQEAKREHVRKDFFGQVEGLFQGSTFYATIQNLGVGGMCFEVDYLFRTGMDLRLVFKVSESDPKVLEVAAEVVWVQPVHMLFNRVGVRFQKLDRATERMINRFVSGLIRPSGLAGAARYPLLFSPFRISNVTLKSRLTMAPMFWGYANEDGTVSQTLIDHYRQIALGEVAMIVVANAVVDQSGIMASRVLRIDHDCFVPGLAKLAEAIKSSGAVACLQINHAGRWASIEKPLTPSPITVDMLPELGALDGMRKVMSKRHQMRLVNKFLSAVMRCRKSMKLKEIASIRTSYGQAALRAREAGFDMMELHGATGYLLAQFLSPRSNKRTDRYGGSLENRMRFPLEVVETVMEFVGKDFPVGYRFLADEWLADGFGIKEAGIFAQQLEALNIAYLSATAGTYESFFLPEIMNQSRKEGYLAPLAKRLKELVPRTPVIAAGRIVSPELAEHMLGDDECDLIGLARALFSDPLWPNKVYEGRESDIVSCKCCNTCLIRVINNEPVVCVRWDKLKRMDLDVQLKQKKDKWEKILIAVDDTRSSLEAVEYAGHMIGQGKRVTLFSIVEEGPAAQTARKERENLLVQAKGLLQSTGMNEPDIQIKVAMKQKRIEEDILDEIEKGEYGSIILGRRGVSRAKQLLFGSISNYIVHHAKNCGVWVID